jgi:hypothetical protein
VQGPWPAPPDPIEFLESNPIGNRLRGIPVRSADSGPAEDETILLLQEEIARLEDELRSRDADADAEGYAHRAGSSSSSSSSASAKDEEAQGRIAQLQGELTAREETIGLLLEQVRLADEAEASSRIEWEQLHQWVQAVERRVEEQGGSGSDRLRAELDAERSRGEARRQAAEKEQRSWEIQRQALVTEVERLRGKFAQVAGESDTSLAAVQALEHENEQLREAYEALARTAVPPHEVEAIDQELQSLRKEREAMAQELKRQRDEREREWNEHEAAINALKSQLARESLRRQEEQVKTTVAPLVADDPLLDADQRIRALREHLKEIHRDETEQRMKRSLASRLSRLWNHTSSNP